jgi:cytochrome c oxidase subunit 2
VGGLAAASLLLSGCSLADLPRFGWPEGHTREGADMQYFWSATFIAALVIGIGVWGLMFWSFALHRKKKGSPLYPKQTKENLPLEIVYTAIPMVLVMILFYFTVTTENKVLKMEANPDVTVHVTAFKWNWDFSYEDTKSPDGTADGLVHTVGTSSEIPMLILPTNKVIQYELASRDVIHSFWVPDFLFKRDVFPSPEANQVDNGDKFQNTITVEGAMVGRCAELCGQYHAMMMFEVRAMPEELYTQYLDLRQKVNTATGRGYTNAEALTEMACGELCAPQAVTTQPFDTRRTADNIIAGGN